MKIDLTKIFLFYISLWVSVLSYSTSAPEDLDMSGDDLELSGSGSGLGDEDVTVTNVTTNSWVTDAPPVRIAQETTVKISVAASPPQGSVSQLPLTTLRPRAETSNSDAVFPQHTTSVYSHDLMAGQNTTATKSEEKIDTATVPVTESVTTQSAVDNTPQFKEVVTTVYTSVESTTALVLGTEEKVTVVTTTMGETTMFSEEEGEGETVATSLTEFEDTTTAAPGKAADAETNSVADETPAAPTTTFAAPDITSGWGGSDDEGGFHTSPTQHSDFNFVEDNIIPDIRRGVEIAKPDDDFRFDNEIRRPNTQHASSENENIFEKKEVLAGVIAGGIVGVAFAVMLIALMAYRMKKKDEGSYALDDHKPTNGDYQIVRKQEEFLA